MERVGTSHGRSPAPRDPLTAQAREAAGGCPQALTSVLGEVRRLAFRHALARTRDIDDAEDVAQEVAVRVFLGLARFQFRARLSSWVFRITENEVRGQVRRRASRTAAERKADLPAREPNPEDRLDGERLRHRVMEAVRMLPSLQGKALQLVALEGHPPREAARRLGKSATNLRAGLCRARVKVAAQLSLPRLTEAGD